MRKSNNPVRRQKVLSVEEFAGKFDVTCYRKQAEAEAKELTEGPGGRFTFSNLLRGTIPAYQYEVEAQRLRSIALQKIK